MVTQVNARTKVKAAFLGQVLKDAEETSGVWAKVICELWLGLVMYDAPYRASQQD